jgi:hypothetical protein
MDKVVIGVVIFIILLIPFGYIITTYLIIPTQIPAFQKFICDNPTPIESNQCDNVMSEEWVKAQELQDYLLTMIGMPAFLSFMFFGMFKIHTWTPTTSATKGNEGSK